MPNLIDFPSNFFANSNTTAPPGASIFINPAVADNAGGVTVTKAGNVQISGQNYGPSLGDADNWGENDNSQQPIEQVAVANVADSSDGAVAKASNIYIAGEGSSSESTSAGDGEVSLDNLVQPDTAPIVEVNNSPIVASGEISTIPPISVPDGDSNTQQPIEQVAVANVADSSDGAVAKASNIYIAGEGSSSESTSAGDGEVSLDNLVQPDTAPIVKVNNSPTVVGEVISTATPISVPDGDSNTQQPIEQVAVANVADSSDGAVAKASNIYIADENTSATGDENSVDNLVQPDTAPIVEVNNSSTVASGEISTVPPISVPDGDSNTQQPIEQVAVANVADSSDGAVAKASNIYIADEGTSAAGGEVWVDKFVQLDIAPIFGVNDSPIVASGEISTVPPISVPDGDLLTVASTGADAILLDFDGSGSNQLQVTNVEGDRIAYTVAALPTNDLLQLNGMPRGTESVAYLYSSGKAEAGAVAIAPISGETDAPLLATANDDSLTYTATLDNGEPLPTWLTFDASTATFSGTPAADDVGILNLQVTATNDAGISASDTFKLEVISIPNRDNAPPATYTQAQGGISRSFQGLPDENGDNPNSNLIISGGAQDDTFSGGSDNDLVTGSFGSDSLQGGDGDDLLFGNQNADFLDGESGDDMLFGGKDSDSLLGSDGNDTLMGNWGADNLDGGEGNDLLFGNQEADLLNGAEGNDMLFGGKDSDSLLGSGGNDTLCGDLGNDSLSGSSGNDWLYGNVGADTLDGGDDADTLHGGKDSDILTGGAGDDLLCGDLGDDILTGESGSDRFALTSTHGSDLIADFEEGIDLLALSASLSFEQLSIIQGTDATHIAIASTGEILASLSGVQAGAISSEDFTLL